MEIFQIHTAQMIKYKKIDPEVDLVELAKRTRNFTGAEIESVVRSAQATAMNRLIEVCLLWRGRGGEREKEGWGGGGGGGGREREVLILIL